MTKIKRVIAVLLAAMLIMFLWTGLGLTVFAEESDPAGTDTETVTPESPDSEAAQFLDYLKAKYGADYEYYYNQIIGKWGSIEGYLLAFGEKLPEEQQSGWNKFVGWLTEYSPVWATALAIIILIIIAVVGKKAFNNAIAKIVNAKLSPIAKELNLQSNATVSMLHAQKALLGNASKFEENVQELEKAEKELTDG